MNDILKLVVAVCVLGLIGCDGPQAPSSRSATASTTDAPLTGQLVLTGSSTVAPLAAEFARRFEARHPGVRVDVQTGGSSRGIADADSGVADIGMASRALKPEEEQLGLASHTLALDGIALIVHRDNPVGSLTDEQVVAVYTGEISNWEQLGGEPAEIVVVHKADGRATQEVFLEYFQLDNAAVRPDVIVGDNQHGIKTVAGSGVSIGYVSVGEAQAEAAGGTPIKLLAAGGVQASTANVAAGKYRLVRQLNFVTKGEPQGVARAFLEFCQSADVHDLIEAQNFVPLRR